MYDALSISSLMYEYTGDARNCRNALAAAGSLCLSINRESNHAIITDKDDDSAMNEKRTRENAVNNGIITQNRPRFEAYFHRLRFAPWFCIVVTGTRRPARGVGLESIKQGVTGLRNRLGEVLQ